MKKPQSRSAFRTLLFVAVLLFCFSEALFAQVTVTTSSLPDGQVGVAYSAPALAATGGTPPYTWSVVTGVLPTGLSLLASTGVISGTPSVSGIFNFSVRATDNNSTQSAPKALSIKIPLGITTSSPLPSGVINTAYSQTLSATPTIAPPLTWSLSSGTLPTGLALTSGGTISGTPTVANTFNFTVAVTDTSTPPMTATKALSITITPAGTVTVTTASLPDGQLGVVYNAPALAATGGTPPYTWSVVSGVLPTGLSLLASTGVISGTPTVSGIFNFSVRATDNNSTQSAPKALSIKIPLEITTSSLPGGVINTAYSQSLSASPTIAQPLTWSLSSGTLPTGLALTSGGSISGTPTALVTSNFTIAVTDSSTPPMTATKALSITIQTGLTITTTSPLPLAVVGSFYLQTLQSSGPTPVTWTITASIPPPGVSLNSNGTLSGTPSLAGTYDFTVQAATTNPNQTVTQQFRIVVNPALTITTPPQLPSSVIGTSYAATLTATGGVSPYTWALFSGTLPLGLSLSTGGVISGTTTTAGNYNFTVQVSDSFTPTLTANRTFTIFVSATLTITTSSLPNGAVGKSYSQNLTASAGTPPYLWVVSSGALPTGLALSTDGIISGTPTSGGTFNFAVNATDSATTQQTATKSLTITIQPLLTITTATPLPLGVVGAFYSLVMEATLTTPLTWTVVSGIAPPGVNLTASGALVGTPQVPGTFDFTVQASGGDPAQTATRALRMVVNEVLRIITPAALPDAAPGANYSVTLEAAGGLPPYTWTNPGRGLPPGLSVSTSGVISGVATGVGSFTFIIQIADSFTPMQQVSRTFGLVVSTSVSITTLTLPTATLNVAYSQQLQGTGSGTLTWVVTAGTLPAGLTLTTGGLLQGTPTEVGTRTVTIAATDNRGTTAAREFAIVVDPPIPALSVPGLPATLTARQVTDISLNISVPHPSALTGQFKLAFTPNAEIASDDPAIQFSNGTRTANFTIPIGTTAAVFASKLMLLTGTIAGTVRLTATFDNGPADMPAATVEIPAVAPQMTEVTAVRTTGGLNVQITGFAPARRVSTVEFSFDIKGAPRKTLSRNVESEFADWYRNAASTPFGSAFSFLQSFTIQGDASEIEGVTVRLSNAQGSTTSATMRPN